MILLCWCQCYFYILECEIPKFIGDGYCDDENNKEACNFDQGDCCPGKHVEVKKDYCTVCACLGDSGAGIVNFVTNRPNKEKKVSN